MFTSDVYRLALSPGLRSLLLGSLIVFSLFGLVMVVATAVSAPWELPGLPFALLLCAGLAWNWYLLVTIPYEIRFETPDRIRFTALARTTTVSAASAHSIKPYRGGGIYIITHQGGTIRLFAQFTGFHEVISRIRAANPQFEVVGI